MVIEKDTPLVSISIPAYKSRYLKDAMLSALNQTYKNIELLIVNDHSPETKEIESTINFFNDRRIRYYVNKLNLGGDDPANNWNKCLSYATGTFFCLLCDDDLYETTFVEEMISLADEHPDCNVFRGRGCNIDKEGKVTYLYPSSPLWETSDDYMYHFLQGLRHQTISEFCYRTDFLKEKGGFLHFPLAWHADYFSIFNIGKQGGITSSNSILVSFRMSGENISSQDTNIIRKLDANNVAYNYGRGFIEKSNSIFKPLLERLLPIWKYKEDRYLISKLSFGESVLLLWGKDNYGLSYKAILMGIFYHVFRNR